MSDNNEIAARANIIEYNKIKTDNYVVNAPHLSHPYVNNLFVDVLDKLFEGGGARTVLDLGSGEGSATIPILERGVVVYAVDSSKSQLDELRRKCACYERALFTVESDAFEAVENFRRSGVKFDIIVLNSFLHHVPDYTRLIDQSANILNKGGVIFTFQDPMKYCEMPLYDRFMSFVIYYSWRICQGDIINGSFRKIRRLLGIYYDNSYHDNAEYHVTRGGVDSSAISKLLTNKNFAVSVTYYFSTQSCFGQKLGVALRIQNTFYLIAKNCD